MLTHKETVEKVLGNLEVRAEYDALEDEFAFLDECLRARKRAGLTQAEVARRMGTKPPAVARIEAAGGKRRPTPSRITIPKYAKAVGCKLEIRRVPKDQDAGGLDLARGVIAPAPPPLGAAL
jgi:transcriptional regulator with XRE-family HTH domain